MLRAPGQAQPFITQAIEAAPADADNIKPLFFIEAKQRGAYEALAEANPSSSAATLPSHTSPPRCNKASPYSEAINDVPLMGIAVTAC